MLFTQSVGGFGTGPPASCCVQPVETPKNPTNVASTLACTFFSIGYVPYRILFVRAGMSPTVRLRSKVSMIVAAKAWGGTMQIVLTHVKLSRDGDKIHA
jgi:hypothetical protein